MEKLLEYLYHCAMAEGAAAPEAPSRITVETIREEPLGSGSLNNLYDVGRFLLTRFDPDITYRESPHRLVRLAKTFGVDPELDLSIDDNFQQGDNNIRMDWEATARVSGEPAQEEDSWTLRTLTMHDIPIKETEEAITADFSIKGGVLRLGVEQGTKADAQQVTGALWDYFNKIREYYRQNAVEAEQPN